MRQHTLRSRQFFDAGFPLFVMEIEQMAIAAHSHDYKEMVYVRRGRGMHVIEGVPYPMRAGDVYFLRPGEAHSYSPEGKSVRIINILWQPSLVRDVLRADAPIAAIEPLLRPHAKASRQFERRLHLSGGAAFRVENLLDEMRREIEAAKIGAPSPGCHALLRHLFCALLVLLSRAHGGARTHRQRAGRLSDEGASQASMSRAIAYLEAHLAEVIRVPEVAAHVALSPGRFAHLFKSHTGRGVIEYLHELRLEKVCAALRESAAPIHEIAAESGYNDPRFFHRVFRRHFGCSPLQWRGEHFDLKSSE
jgi:AraC-like DNA-binding protein